MIKTLKHSFLKGLFVLLLMYYAVLIGWYAAYSNFFFYPVFYQMADVHGYVLDNARYNTEGREDFAYVGSNVHLKIFYDIMHDVENGGMGLSTIGYESGKQHKIFLTVDELKHMQKFADGLDTFKSLWRVLLILFFVVLGLMAYERVIPYYFSTVLKTVVVCALLIFVSMYYFGVSTVSVFTYNLIMPSGYEWVFTPTNSNLALILKAPENLIYYALFWSGCAVLFFLIGYKVVTSVVRYAISRYL